MYIAPLDLMQHHATQAGVVLERFVTTFEGLAVLAPIINGIGGNLGAVIASRISTALHANSRSASACTNVI